MAIVYHKDSPLGGNVTAAHSDYSFIGGGQTNTLEPPPKRNTIMDQYIISPKKLIKALEEAFQSGYESPIEVMDQEIARIYKEAFAEIHAVGVSPEEPTTPRRSIRPQVMFDTDGILQDREWYNI